MLNEIAQWRQEAALLFASHGEVPGYDENLSYPVAQVKRIGLQLRRWKRQSAAQHSRELTADLDEALEKTDIGDSPGGTPYRGQVGWHEEEALPTHGGQQGEH